MIDHKLWSNTQKHCNHSNIFLIVILRAHIKSIEFRFFIFQHYHSSRRMTLSYKSGKETDTEATRAGGGDSNGRKGERQTICIVSSLSLAICMSWWCSFYVFNHGHLCTTPPPNSEHKISFLNKQTKYNRINKFGYLENMVNSIEFLRKTHVTKTKDEITNLFSFN